jgi:hypothetical protein
MKIIDNLKILDKDNKTYYFLNRNNLYFSDGSNFRKLIDFSITDNYYQIDKNILPETTDSFILGGEKNDKMHFNRIYVTDKDAFLTTMKVDGKQAIYSPETSLISNIYNFVNNLSVKYEGNNLLQIQDSNKNNI